MSNHEFICDNWFHKYWLRYGHLVLLSGKVVVELTKSESAYIQAAVLLHPSFIALDDIKGIPFITSFWFFLLPGCGEWSIVSLLWVAYVSYVQKVSIFSHKKYSQISKLRMVQSLVVFLREKISGTILVTKKFYRKVEQWYLCITSTLGPLFNEMFHLST